MSPFGAGYSVGVRHETGNHLSDNMEQSRVPAQSRETLTEKHCRKQIEFVF